MILPANDERYNAFATECMFPKHIAAIHYISYTTIVVSNFSILLKIQIFDIAK
jgi:hypothetical protein